MVEFARDTINHVIYSLSRRLPLSYDVSRALVHGIPIVKLPILEKDECERIIALVAEPVLKQSLMRLYSTAYPETATDFIDQQIVALQKLKKNDRNTN